VTTTGRRKVLRCRLKSMWIDLIGVKMCVHGTFFGRKGTNVEAESCRISSESRMEVPSFSVGSFKWDVLIRCLNQAC
jgi:hypothetical protein